jgi:hypothetical protein
LFAIDKKGRKIRLYNFFCQKIGGNMPNCEQIDKFFDTRLSLYETVRQKKKIGEKR